MRGGARYCLCMQGPGGVGELASVGACTGEEEV